MEILKEEKRLFLNVAKRVLKTKVSNNPKKLKEYETEIKAAYNKCFINLNLLEESNPELLSDIHSFKKLAEVKKYSVLEKINILTFSNFLPTIKEELEKMSELSISEFLKLCSSIMNKNFSGDPLGLESFISAIELMKPLAVAANQTNYLVAFIKTKLEGKAFDAVPSNVNTIDGIVENLRKNIKHENSKIIEGKLMALKTDQRNLTDFTKKAEELSEALKRALVIEGISNSKANEMAIERTIEMCRSSTRSDIVKSVVSSSNFESSKDVISKFLIEITREKKDQQVLAYRNYKPNYRGNSNRGYHSRGYNHNNRGKNNYSNNISNNYNNNFGNNRRPNYRRGYNNSYNRNNNRNPNNVRAIHETSENLQNPASTTPRLEEM
jgi:hypothetical protein